VNVSIELPSDLENELSAEASQLKLPLVDYILRVLSFRPFLQNLPQTGLDLVAHWETSSPQGIFSFLVSQFKIPSALELLAAGLKARSWPVRYLLSRPDL